MTRTFALALIAGVQLVFMALTLVLLVGTRLRGNRSARRIVAADLSLAPALQKVMLGDDHGEALAAALNTLERDVAVQALLVIGASRLSAEQRQRVASLVRHSPWVERTLGLASSRWWWKRMEAARLLAIVCDGRDEALVARLVTDPHPAVASSATGAIAGCAGEVLVDAVVRGLPARPTTVRQQQSNALRTHAPAASAAVADFLSRPAGVRELRAWVQLAEILATPQALASVAPLATHEDVEIRTSVARALRNYFSPDAVRAVTHLMRDSDWRVRAAAARAIGALKIADAVPLLTDSLRDRAWWVRFRAALALAELSADGRKALTDAMQSGDPYARDMASLVCGLSVGTRLALTAS